MINWFYPKLKMLVMQQRFKNNKNKSCINLELATKVQTKEIF